MTELLLNLFALIAFVILALLAGVELSRLKRRVRQLEWRDAKPPEPDRMIQAIAAARVAQLELALQIIGWGHTDQFPGAPDVMTVKAEEYRAAMWTWSQLVAKAALAKEESS